MNPTAETEKGLEKAEAGDVDGARKVNEAEQQNQEAAEAAEKVASDGPPGRGLAR